MLQRAARGLWSLLAVAGGLLFLAQPSASQQTTLNGVVVDSSGAPLADMPVALHRVSAGGGANVDQTVSDPEGRFTFSMDVAGDSALYFAATRAGSFLYVGPPIRGGSGPEEYILAVGPEGNRIPMAGPATGAGPGTGPAPRPAPPAQSFDEGTAGTAVLLTAALVMLAALFFGVRWSQRHRERGRREALLELARLEERSAAQEGPVDPSLAEQRKSLRRQIASLS